MIDILFELLLKVALNGTQISVNTWLLRQRFVGAFLHDVSSLEHENFVCMHDGG